MRLIKKLKVIVFIIISIEIILFVTMQIDTNSIIHDIEEAFYCTDYYIPEYKYCDKYNNPRINYVMYTDDEYKTNIYAHFNSCKYYSDTNFTPEKLRIKLKLKRVYTIHNFCHGYIWIKYSRELYDEDNNRFYGSWDTPIKIEIKKIDGKWQVIKIYEPVKPRLDFWINTKME